MDNIELNHAFVKGMTDADKIQIRDGFFNYMNRYAEQVTGSKDAKVCFYSRDVHVPTGDLEKFAAVTDFIGELSQEKVYVNSAGCSWINPAELNQKGKIEWLRVPKK